MAAMLALGERYNRTDNILFYTAGIDSSITQKLHLSAYVSYDGKAQVLSSSTVTAVYTEQCWALNVAVTRRPGDSVRPADVSFGILFELKGIGKFRVL
jgi:LPS-assembly protein